MDIKGQSSLRMDKEAGKMLKIPSEAASSEAHLSSPGSTGRLNSSFGEGFILVGFSDWPQLELVLLVFISIFYSLTLFGNSAIIALSRLDLRLHTPMYFFLCHLSFLDLCYTTSTVPQLLIHLHGHDRTITYRGCVAQLFISLALGGTECMLLVVMAFDRYAAVCRPLHYMTIMHPHFCQILTAISWVGGFMNSLVQTGLMMAMPLCGLHQLDHFFCEMPVLLKLACEDTQGTEVKMFVARVIMLVVPAALILTSYVHIARAVLNVNSIAGRRKAFGTCGSHLLVVSLFYGSAMYAYLQPTSSYSQSEGKFVALFYTIITPMLNPMIYTLRNKDVKGALRKVLWKNFNCKEVGRLVTFGKDLLYKQV
ncbi:olfactory receptor 2Y1B-like [Tenrec ecaudatus]|uniref:olfactory receptor 2Y1B-like n=1 Tax=Tenrec ecaudatus TaxID=94439 RepID=UPI003F5A900F